jgi:chromosome segregation protein
LGSGSDVAGGSRCASSLAASGRCSTFRFSSASSSADEAEAALDDVNLARFLTVVDSHRATGQYLLVTHQKRTMAAADVLYGVVQDAAGATTVVSKRMQGE